MNSNKPSVIGPFGKRPAEEISLSVPSAQSLLVNQLLSKLTPVPPSQIPADMMKINPPDFFCDPVMPEEPGHPELLDGSSYLEPLENPSQMLEPKSRNKRKLVKPKPKKSAVKQIQSNKNRSLRKEQAENIMKYRVCQRGCSLTHSARTPPAVHLGLTIWGVNGGSPPHFFGG